MKTTLWAGIPWEQQSQAGVWISGWGSSSWRLCQTFSFLCCAGLASAAASRICLLPKIPFVRLSFDAFFPSLPNSSFPPLQGNNSLKLSHCVHSKVIKIFVGFLHVGKFSEEGSKDWESGLAPPAAWLINFCLFQVNEPDYQYFTSK